MQRNHSALTTFDIRQKHTIYFARGGLIGALRCAYKIKTRVGRVLPRGFCCLICVIMLLGELDNGTGCNPFGLGVDWANADVGTLEVDVDDCLRTREFCVLKHLAYSDIAHCLL